MFLKHIDLTTALRPSYLPDEVLLFVQDNVGLYEGYVCGPPRTLFSSATLFCHCKWRQGGRRHRLTVPAPARSKYKLPRQQNGQVYLTSHRICYVDKLEPRASSVALELKEVDRYDYYAGFLKSSPKVTIVPKPSKRSSLHSRAISKAVSPPRNSSASPGFSDSAYRPPPSGPPPVTTATWVCTICSFSNPIPVNFDAQAANAHTPLPPCLACGIKPTLSHVLKAAITNASNRPSPAPPAPHAPALALRPRLSDPSLPPTPKGLSASTAPDWPRPSADAGAAFSCPRCTFSNHPSLLACEICGAPLVSRNTSSMSPEPSADDIRTQSPGPVMDRAPSSNGRAGIDVSDSVKISFRGGGDKIFHERLKGAMTQRKWLLQNAPPAPRAGGRMADEAGGNGGPGEGSGGRAKTAGIAGLEQLGLNMRKNNELLIGSAFEDLEALMSSAKEVIALA